MADLSLDTSASGDPALALDPGETTPTAPASGRMERTLALLSHPSLLATSGRNDVESRLVAAGFDVVGERKLSGAECEEVGGWFAGLGEGSGPYLLLCLERQSAFTFFSELISPNNTSPSSLSAAFPPGSFHSPAVPQLAQAAMARFFPDLPPLGSPLAPLGQDDGEDDYLEEEQLNGTPSRTNGTAGFKARGLPSTHLQPSSQPRMSRAAMIRMGITPPPKATKSTDPKEPDMITPGVNKRALDAHEVPKSLAGPKLAPRQTKSSALRSGDPAAAAEAKEKERLRKLAAANREPDLITPGVNKRPLSTTELPKSLAAPSIAPRTTRAAALRRGDAVAEKPPPAVRRTSSNDQEAFAETPGHKRMLSLQVDSLKQPTVAPRGTRSSMARAGGAGTPSGSSAAFASPSAVRERPARPLSYDNVPGYKRATKVEVASTAAPAITPRGTKASQLRSGGGALSPPDGYFALQRVPSGASLGSSSAASVSSPASATRERTTPNFEGVPGHKRRESMPVASTKAPTIAPRGTKASQLRAGGEAMSPGGGLRREASLEGVQEEEEERRPTFENVPGHRRVDRIAVASTKAPTITPRLTKAAALRAQQGAPTEARGPKPIRSWSRDDGAANGNGLLSPNSKSSLGSNRSASRSPSNVSNASAAGSTF